VETSYPLNSILLKNLFIGKLQGNFVLYAYTHEEPIFVMLNAQDVLALNTHEEPIFKALRM